MSDNPNKVVESAKRKPPAAGIGRQKGVPNKLTKALKDMILGALDKAGGEKYLAEQADKNPAAFMTLVGKVLPLQVTGEGGGPLVITKVAEATDEQLAAIALGKP